MFGECLSVRYCVHTFCISFLDLMKVFFILVFKNFLSSNIMNEEMSLYIVKYFATFLARCNFNLRVVIEFVSKQRP